MRFGDSGGVCPTRLALLPGARLDRLIEFAWPWFAGEAVVAA